MSIQEDPLDLSELLVVPDAFKSIKSSEAAVEHDEWDSPRPRKLARTTTGATAGRRVNASGPKRIPLRHAVDFELANGDDIRTIRHAISTLLEPRLCPAPPSASRTSYRSVASASESLVLLQQKGAEVYDTLKLQLEQNVSRIADKLDHSSARGVAWLEELGKRWEIFDRSLSLIRSLLVCVDQAYILNHATDKLPVRDLGRLIFRDKILTSENTQKRFDEGVTDFLWQERHTEHVTELRSVFPPIAHLLLCAAHKSDHSHHDQKRTLKFFDILLKPYLRSTNKFYFDVSKQIDTTDPVDYVKMAHLKIEQEVTRAEVILNVDKDVLEFANVTEEFSVLSRVQKVRDAVEVQLLGDGRMSRLSDKVLPIVFKERSIPMLTVLYNLCKHLHAVDDLRRQFTALLVALVSEIVAPSPPSAEADEKMISSLLALRTFAETVATKAFGESAHGGDRAWRNCVTDAFEKGFTKRPKKPAEMIAKYIDKAMRKGQEAASDEEFQKALDDALSLYRFIKDRDVFREFYIRSLAKRLLLQKSASDDFEINVLKRLKQHDKYFEKGDGMFSDLQVSRDLMSEWHKDYIQRAESEDKLSVTILQHSNWPTYSRTTVLLPKEMETALSSFLVFYKSKHKQRKLDWAHGLTTVTLSARFSSGVKELHVSLLQAVVLLMFENGGNMTFLDIKEASGIEDGELRRTLQSLALGRKRVLTKTPMGRDVNDTDQFAYNAKFTDKSYRIHINSIQQTETAEEAAEIATHIEEDRTHALDAAIVRIMKAKKVLRHQQLQTAVIEAVVGHFVPDVSAIKKQIDSLIEREYLQRQAGNRTVYEYLA